LPTARKETVRGMGEKSGKRNLAAIARGKLTRPVWKRKRENKGSSKLQRPNDGRKKKKSGERGVKGGEGPYRRPGKIGHVVS